MTNYWQVVQLGYGGGGVSSSLDLMIISYYLFYDMPKSIVGVRKKNLEYLTIYSLECILAFMVIPHLNRSFLITLIRIIITLYKFCNALHK